ncbi:GTPase ObgE [Veillonella magna]|uniref:GTPase Obg n=1 Tax=Veillonella magna TaxID=464322 RepID=A0ABS2GF93_9FIRM|nr:GTPase ObgE [Veillonella magna]MBM6824207.1 GTPase ObgE [Veillonella magna]MBM6912500.1 GTPase ObgE [Veillonella magna]
MFIDSARIFVKAGDGGNGMSSFRREKYVPNGGPNGGDGGRGADIILKADRNINTLVDFRYKRQFKGPAGEGGQSSNKYGRNAESLIIPVPMGTTVRDEESGLLMADLIEDGQTFVVAKGGRGGRGNAHFHTSSNRAPTFAEKGEPGEERWVRLELKVLADVGLLGYPSVGKSSIIRKVSSAKPEVAAYHFTTLTPVLGVVSVDDGKSFVMADIPGLIEGASEGVGLGHNFLRHVERSNILIHVLDVSGIEGRDPIEDFHKINEELKKYSEKLSKKPQLIALNKIDLVEDVATIDRVRSYFEENGYEVFTVNALTGEGLSDLVHRAWYYVENYVPEPDATDDVVMYEAKPDVDFVITRGDDAAFIITGARIEKLVAMTNLDDEQSLRRFQKIWKYMELDKKLQEKGCKDGDEVVIGDQRFVYHD